MSKEFQNEFTTLFIFKSDLSGVLLVKNTILIPYTFFMFCKDKLSGITCKKENDQFQFDLEKECKKILDKDIKPDQFILITSLQNIEKNWKINIVATISDFEHESFYSIKQLPHNIIPYVSWLVPMCCDLSVHGSQFNQIIMK
jgi:hypothetical protein